jgi:formylmethanofuran dehydrogenase subunit B
VTPITHADSVCTACGCLCDDIELVIDGDRIIAARSACPRGEAMLLGSVAPAGPACRIGGQAATVDEGVHRAAQILRAANSPLVLSLAQATCETHRAAVSLADRVGATLDTSTGLEGPAVAMALQRVGQVTATLGELRHRADLVILWGVNPAESHPRLLEKHLLHPAGRFVPRGRADRTCIVIDAERTATAEQADLFLALSPQRQFEAIWTLRAIVKGVDLNADDVQTATGVALADWLDLADRMKRARYGVVVFGPELTLGAGRHLNAEAILLLTRELNAHTRFVCLALRGGGNPTGADNVLASRTGFPFAVNFARGYPRFRATEYAAGQVLQRKEADAVVIVGRGDATLDLDAVGHAALGLITLDAADVLPLPNATVAFAVAPFVRAVPGTVYRMDGVALPLRPATVAGLQDADVLRAIEREVQRDS